MNFQTAMSSVTSGLATLKSSAISLFVTPEINIALVGDNFEAEALLRQSGQTRVVKGKTVKLNFHSFNSSTNFNSLNAIIYLHDLQDDASFKMLMNQVQMSNLTPYLHLSNLNITTKTYMLGRHCGPGARVRYFELADFILKESQIEDYQEVRDFSAANTLDLITEMTLPREQEEKAQKSRRELLVDSINKRKGRFNIADLQKQVAELQDTNVDHNIRINLQNLVKALLDTDFKINSSPTKAVNLAKLTSLDKGSCSIVIQHFTKFAIALKNNPKPSKAFLEKWAKNLDAALYGKPPLHFAVTTAIFAVIGAVLGAIVGFTVASIATGGIGSLPGAFAGAVKGFALGETVAVATASTAGLFALGFGVKGALKSIENHWYYNICHKEDLERSFSVVHPNVYQACKSFRPQ